MGSAAGRSTGSVSRVLDALFHVLTVGALLRLAQAGAAHQLDALSPGINDPFTAMTCIDRLTTALLHLMRRDFPTRFRVDGEGSLRVIADRPDFAGIVDAAFHQIRQSGASMPAVAIRLLESLSLLLEYASTDQHRRALKRHASSSRSPRPHSRPVTPPPPACRRARSGRAG